MYAFGYSMLLFIYIFKLFQTIVGKIERIGISNIMGAPGALSISAGMYTRPSLTSPMAQLTCLLPSHVKEITYDSKAASSLPETPQAMRK